MGYQEKLKEMVNAGLLNMDQAKDFEQSIAQLTPTPGSIAGRKQLHLGIIASGLGVIMIGGLFVAATRGTAHPEAPEVIQNVAQGINQPDVTGNIGSAATGFVTLFLLLLIPVIAIILIIANKYNILVRLDEDAKRCRAIIGASLQKRYDLLPNLMVVVKQAMAFEETLQSTVTTQRSGKAAVLESALLHAEADKTDSAALMPKLSAVIEAYPVFRSQENVLSLQHSLLRTEESLEVARNIYNASIADLNSELRGVIGGFVGKLCGMKEENYFSAETPAQKKSILS
jgi:LemA protein